MPLDCNDHAVILVPLVSCVHHNSLFLHSFFQVLAYHPSLFQMYILPRLLGGTLHGWEWTARVMQKQKQPFTLRLRATNKCHSWECGAYFLCLCLPMVGKREGSNSHPCKATKQPPKPHQLPRHSIKWQLPMSSEIRRSEGSGNMFHDGLLTLQVQDSDCALSLLSSSQMNWYGEATRPIIPTHRRSRSGDGKLHSWLQSR